MKSKIAWLALALMVPFSGYSQEAKLRLARIFCDNAVLQRDIEVPVWGWSAPGAEVKVTFKDQTVSAKTDESGKWMARLKALSADDKGAELTAQTGSETFTAKNVLVGEVWLCGGRSQWSVSVDKMVAGTKDKDPTIESEVAQINYPSVRMISVATKKPTPEPQPDFDSKGWVQATPASIRQYPAISVIFAHNLHKSLKVPVGIITNNWGGSSAPLWIRFEAYEAFTKGATDSGTDAEYEKESAAHHKKGAGDYADNKKPGILWNSHVYPLVPYAIRGLVWYLDDIDGPKAEVLVKDWRKQWGQDFAVLLNQVHPSDKAGKLTDPDMGKMKAKTPETREGLMNLEKKLQNVWTNCCADLGDEVDPGNIHPFNKRPVGERLALLARAKVYGEDIPCHSPVFKEMKLDGNKAVISFDYPGGGLVCQGEKLGGFAISDGKTWAWAEGSVTAPDQVTLTHPSGGTPQAVRYAWAGYPLMTLYTKEGLPAAPFRTDK